MIYIIKGFGVVNKAKVDVFLELLLFRRKSKRESFETLCMLFMKLIFFFKAQQDVPAWLEEIAFSTYGPGFSGNARGNVFASVDTRKVS